MSHKAILTAKTNIGTFQKAIHQVEQWHKCLYQNLVWTKQILDPVYSVDKKELQEIVGNFWNASSQHCWAALSVLQHALVEVEQETIQVPVVPEQMVYFSIYFDKLQYPLFLGLCRYPQTIQVKGKEHSVPFYTPDFGWKLTIRQSDFDNRKQFKAVCDKAKEAVEVLQKHNYHVVLEV